jgi:N-acetyl-anhydromuramyl-L-alanine amidase AmpD
MNIIQKPASSSTFTASPRTLPAKLVVIHVEAGTETATINWFANPQAHVSAHYSVSQAGTIYQHVQEDHTAWHAGIPAPFKWNDNTKNKWPGANPNSYSIGIEHEGFDDGKPWPDTQVQASASLVADICKRHGIPMDRQHIVGHHEIYAGHTCPGKACPIDQIVSMAAAL